MFNPKCVHIYKNPEMTPSPLPRDTNEHWTDGNAVYIVTCCLCSFIWSRGLNSNDKRRSVLSFEAIIIINFMANLQVQSLKCPHLRYEIRDPEVPNLRRCPSAIPVDTALKRATFVPTQLLREAYFYHYVPLYGIHFILRLSDWTFSQLERNSLFN